VLARKDSWSYRTAKFVRRHKVGVAAAALVALSLLGGIAATARQARIAHVNQARAERRFNDVRRLADSFLFEFHDAIRDLPGSTKAREMVVARALEYLDGLSADAQPDPSLQRELAVAYQRLGDIQGGPGNGNLGDTKGALASYEKAHALRRALASSGDPRDEEGLASLERSLAQLLFMAGDLRRADEFARAASARLERLVAAGGPDVQIALASAYHGRGFLAARNGDEVSAEEWLGKAASAARAYCDSHPADGSARALLARIESDLVERLGRRGEHVRAAKLAQSIRDILERLVADEPHNAGYRRKLVHALNIGSDEMEAAGDLEGANAARRRSLELALALVAADPANLGDRIALSYSEQYLGAGLIHSGQAEEGLDHLRRALRSSAEIIESDPKNAFARTRRAHIQAELGLALDREGRRTAEMCSSLRESAMFWEAPEHEGQAREIRVDLIRAALAACPRPGARAE
jgi:non-specific serine/threonine protein kinase/serine/threonine-protein kinase